MCCTTTSKQHLRICKGIHTDMLIDISGCNSFWSLINSPVTHFLYHFCKVVICLLNLFCSVIIENLDNESLFCDLKPSISSLSTSSTLDLISKIALKISQLVASYFRNFLFPKIKLSLGLNQSRCLMKDGCWWDIYHQYCVNSLNSF